MTNKIIGIQGNHPSKLNIKSDTTIFLAIEAQNKNYKIFYYEPSNLSIINDKVIAKGYFLKFNYLDKKFFKIIKKRTINLSHCKFLLIRQDPPFNLEYISTTYILDKLKNKIKIINDPTSIRNISEKLYSSLFQKYMPDTIFTKDLNKIKKFYKKNKKIIIKPIHSFGGNDIHLIQNSFKKYFISKFIKKHGHIMCQKFLSKIKYGDKRVWVINGKICGAISRVPKKGSFLSNLGKGAKATTTKLNKIELKVSKIIAKNLKKQNIYFAGIDFIDQKLNGDINVTSPTGLKTYFDLTGINLAKVFWKGLKA
jgi:glutathione synthase|tara:strand:+ start:26 stop:955 length:930 start_codon:yes stop_codon:yes gene_type:complete